MNRRDFLFFRTESNAQLAELSCENLYMHYQDLCSGFNQAPAEAGTLNDTEWWAGEPPLQIGSGDPEAFFRSVQSELGSADKLRVRDMQWLAQGDFRIRVETLLAAFKAKGGEVTYQEVTYQEVAYQEMTYQETTAGREPL